MQAPEIEVDCEVLETDPHEATASPDDDGDRREHDRHDEGRDGAEDPEHSDPESGEGDQAPSGSPATPPFAAMATEAGIVARLYNIAAEHVSFLTEAPKPTLDNLLKTLQGRPRYLPHLDLDRDASTPALGPGDALIFVTCHYDDIALAAAHSLIETRFPDHDKCYLDLNGDAKDCTIEVLERMQRPVETPRVVLIEITHETYFLESLKFGGHIALDHVTTSLRSHNTTIVCASADHLIEDGLDEPILSKYQVPHWRIAFERCILAQVYGREAARAEQELAKQRQDGRWPQDTAEFYAEIKRYWSTGAAALKEQLELRRTDEGLRQAQAVTAAEVFPEDRGVEQLAICTAVYFRDLTPRDFEAVLTKALESRTIEVEETEEHIDDEGKVITIKNKVPKLMTHLWRQAPDAILHRCQLCQVTTGNGGCAIDFSEPYLRRKMRLFIEREYPMLVANYFTRLQEQGLVFDPQLSEDVTGNLVRLAVQRNLEDPGYYGERWLIESVIGMRSFVTVQLDPDDSQETRLTKILASIQGEHLWSHFCLRLSDLIREMLKHPTLEDLVRRFLQNLLHRHQQATLDIVLHIARNLRFVRRFDSLYWLRILLDQGRADIRSKTYAVLHHLALAAGGRIYELLAGIHGWLPGEERAPENYSPSQRLALQFIMVFTLGTATSYHPDFYGEWPCRYILFKAFADNEQETETLLDMLISWMHHPSLPTVVREDVEDRKTAHQRNVADIIEIWSWILEGTRPSAEAAPQAMALMSLILALLARKTDRGQRRIIVKRWYERQRLYLELLNRLPIARRGERSELTARRLKLIELGRRLESSVAAPA